MNNKQLGTAWEKEVCEILHKQGYWVHFITPDSRGAQPFDIIAVKDGKAKAIDCKTSVKAIFSISRLEDNQIYAFEKWISCGNDMPEVWVKYKNKCYVLSYNDLKKYCKVNLNDVDNSCKVGNK